MASPSQADGPGRWDPRCHEPSRAINQLRRRPTQCAEDGGRPRPAHRIRRSGVCGERFELSPLALKLHPRHVIETRCSPAASPCRPLRWDESPPHRSWRRLGPPAGALEPLPAQAQGEQGLQSQPSRTRPFLTRHALTDRGMLRRVGVEQPSLADGPPRHTPLCIDLRHSAPGEPRSLWRPLRVPNCEVQSVSVRPCRDLQTQSRAP